MGNPVIVKSTRWQQVPKSLINFIKEPTLTIQQLAPHTIPGGVLRATILHFCADFFAISTLPACPLLTTHEPPRCSSCGPSKSGRGVTNSHPCCCPAPQALSVLLFFPLSLRCRIPSTTRCSKPPSAENNFLPPVVHAPRPQIMPPFGYRPRQTLISRLPSFPSLPGFPRLFPSQTNLPISTLRLSNLPPPAQYCPTRPPCARFPTLLPTVPPRFPTAHRVVPACFDPIDRPSRVVTASSPTWLLVKLDENNPKHRQIFNHSPPQGALLYHAIFCQSSIISVCPKSPRNCLIHPYLTIPPLHSLLSPHHGKARLQIPSSTTLLPIWISPSALNPTRFELGRLSKRVLGLELSLHGEQLPFPWTNENTAKPPV